MFISVTFKVRATWSLLGVSRPPEPWRRWGNKETDVYIHLWPRQCTHTTSVNCVNCSLFFHPTCSEHLLSWTNIDSYSSQYGGHMCACPQRQTGPADDKHGHCSSDVAFIEKLKHQRTYYIQRRSILHLPCKVGSTEIWHFHLIICLLSDWLPFWINKDKVYFFSI